MPTRSWANAFRRKTFKGCGVYNGGATTFVHSKKKAGIATWSRYLVIPNCTNGLAACGCPGQDFDAECQLQQAAKALQKHRWMLQCEERSIKHRLRYFEVSVSSTACFAAEHRPVYRKHLQKYNIQFRKYIRRIVGPPPGTNWSGQWHDVLHEWNMRVDRRACASGIPFLVKER